MLGGIHEPYIDHRPGWRGGTRGKPVWRRRPADAAKTLVYCSEGSPEGFNPSLYTSGTTFDASAQTIYNRLVEFEIGTTKLIPGLATSWSVSKDGLAYTFKLRRGVRWHSTKYFKPTRNFNADDVLFSFNRQHNKNHPYHKVSGGTYEYYNGMDMPKLVKKVEKVDAYTVRFVLNKREAPFIANMAMDFASIMSKEYADKMAKAGTKQKVDLEPIGTGPFQFVAYQKDAVIRYPGAPAVLAWQGQDRQSDLRHHQGSVGALGPNSGPANATSSRIRPRPISQP